MFHVTRGLKSITGSLSGSQVISVLNRAMSGQTYTTLKVTKPKDFVVHVEMNRPEKRNAMNNAFFKEIGECFNSLDDDPDCRVIVLSGAGKIFTSGKAGVTLEAILRYPRIIPAKFCVRATDEGSKGIVCDTSNQSLCCDYSFELSGDDSNGYPQGLDLSDLGTVMMIRENENEDLSRKAFKIKKFLSKWQESFSAVEKCAKPVIAAVHSACVGGGVDLTAACDIRYCTQDAWFQIKEIDLGLAADLGTLQRFPKVIGNESTARELALTARPFYAEEAKQIGYVSRLLQDKESLLEAALETASLIASKSPVAVQGTKINMVYSKDHTVKEGLEYMVTWNQNMLQSEDLMKAATAMLSKEKPTFSKL